MRGKRYLSIILVVTMLATVLPTKVFAEKIKSDFGQVGEAKHNVQAISKKDTNREARIIEEDVSKRQSNIKHFLKDNGSYEAVVYNQPVHYLKDGKWEDINNGLDDGADNDLAINDGIQTALDSGTSEGEVYKNLIRSKGRKLSYTNGNNNILANKDNDFKVNVAKTSKSKKVVDIKKDNYEISWNLADANGVEAKVTKMDDAQLDEVANEAADQIIKSDKSLNSESDAEKQENKKILVDNEKKKTLTNVASKVTFNGVFKDVDLQYNLLGNKIKENIVLKKNVDNQVFKFNLNVKNLEAKINENNEIVFYDSKDAKKILFKSDAPIMMDANNKDSSNIKMNLEKSVTGYVLTLEPDKNWLESSKRKYPVVIDPTTKTADGISDIADTFVCSNDNDNKWVNQYLRVGNTPVVGTTRSYIKFQTPNLTASDMVIDAQLVLTLSDTENGGGQVDVHKVTNDYSPYYTRWGNQPNHDSKIEDYAIVNGSNKQIAWNITGVVKDWYNTGANYGVMLSQNNEATGDCKFFSSDTNLETKDSSGKTNPPELIRPKVNITYISNVGLENYWTYHSQSVGRAGTSYLNDYNGNLVLIHNDITMNGSRMPISIKHIFNSSEKNINIGSGSCWRLNINQRVEQQIINGVNYYKYTDEDGTIHYFNDTGATQLSDELNLGMTLTKESDGTVLIKDKKDNKIDFNRINSDLNYIKDANGNTTTFTYGSTSCNGVRNITKITDATGRSIILNYTNSVLSSIVDSSQRTTYYNYDGNGNLTSIIYPDNKVSTYNYDGNHNLINYVNYDGTKISYQYYGSSPYRVSDILESTTNGTLGDELSVAYGNNSTTFTDEKGRKNIYNFDDSGKTVNVIGADGSAQYYKYTDSLNATQLGSESKLEKTVVNLLLNHSAEDSSYWLYNRDGGNGTCGFSNEASYMGNSSLKITKSDNISRQYMQEYTRLTKGKTYTFSAYVKTVNVSNTHSGGAVLDFYYKDRAGNYQCVESNVINGTNDWQRMELTFTLPTDASDDNVITRLNILSESGTAYFDCMQLEEESVANRYNLVDNGDISGTSGTPDRMITVAANGSDGVVTTNDSDHPALLNNRVYQMTGAYGSQKQLGQSIFVNGKAGDVYTFGGWAKAYAVPSGTFKIRAAFITINGPQFVSYDFNKDSNDWQYVSGEGIANADYSRIDLYYFYFDNANTAYFDGLQLYKEEFSKSYQYDSKGNVISTADLAKQNSKYEYNSTNDLVKATDTKGNNFKYEYDDKHNIKKSTSAENVVCSFEYDNYGNPKKSTVGDGSLFIQSNATYSESGNYIKSLTDSMGNTVNYNYNETKGTLDSVTDPKGSSTNYSYDPLNDNLLQVTKNVDGKDIKNSYSYKNDRIDSITHNGFSYNFGYDSLGNTTTVSVGNQNLITNQYTDRESLLQKSTYGNGQTTENQYDSLNRVIAKLYNGATSFRYTYDNEGNLARHEDLVNGVNYRYRYDLSDRLTKIEDSSGNSTVYDFDSNNNSSKVTENIGNQKYTTSYSYDKDNKPVQTVLNSGAKIDNKYDAIARLTSKTLNTGAANYVTNYSYLAGVNGSSTTKLGSIDNNGSKINYTYDKNGNIETLTTGDKVIKYYYNELNELIREDNGVLNKTITYSYDAGGNITSKTEYAYTKDALGNKANTINYGYGDANWKDKLTSYNGQNITYDAIGNPLSYNGWNLTWQNGRQLASMIGNGNSISYKYNDAGIRTQKTVNGVTTNYHLSGDKVSYETNGVDNIYYSYDASGKLTSMNLNGTEYYYIRNAQGDVIGLIDKSGAQVVSYTYDSWGKLVSIDGSLKDSIGVKNPYRYRGYRYDTETGLYYLQSRYYSPEWGRFINADSLGGKMGVLLSHNVFAYSNNNPVNMIDPSGHWAIALGFVAEAIGGVAATVGAVLSSPIVIAGAAIAATCLLGYAIYTYCNSSTGPTSFSSGTSDSGGIDGVIPNTISDGGGDGGGDGGSNPEPSRKPKGGKKVTEQVHHFLTNKSKKYTPQIVTIVSKYKLDLDGDWNKALMQHFGRHCNMYHEFMIKKITEIDGAVGGDVELFKSAFEGIKEYIKSNPDKLYRRGW